MRKRSKECIACQRDMTHVHDNWWRCPVHGDFNMPVDDEDGFAASSDKVCPQMDSCYKMDMILDKDILDFQAAEAIRSVCAKCTIATAV